MISKYTVALLSLQSFKQALNLPAQAIYLMLKERLKSNWHFLSSNL